MAQQMGQYRFGGSGATSSITPILSYKAIAMSGDTSTEATSFQDIQISPAGGSFLQDHDYYLQVQIPQDMNYTMSFDIQLIKGEDAGDNTYQFIKNVTITRGGNGDNAYTVVLYEDLDGNTVAMIPEPYVAGTPNTRNWAYLHEATGNYYIGNGGTTYSRLSNYNDMAMIASWRQELTDNFGIFEMVFRPIDSGFNYIHLKMIRTAEDYNIQRVLDNGSMEYGRKVDIGKVKATLYALENLVPNISPTGLLNRIGIWGHPGLLMIINGEEIHITANGYYELDDFPITSIGIVAPDGDWTNFFTIDYEYESADG